MLKIVLVFFLSPLLLLVAPAAAAVGQNNDHHDLLAEIETTEPIILDQLARAEQCSGSPYARACRQDSTMLFAQTMLGSCTPVGCFDLAGETSATVVVKV